MLLFAAGQVRCMAGCLLERFHKADVDANVNAVVQRTYASSIFRFPEWESGTPRILVAIWYM